MQIKDATIHHRQIFACFSELDLRAILTKKIAEETGFDICPRKTKIKMTISQKDKGAAGFEHYVEITMTNDLSNQELI